MKLEFALFRTQSTPADVNATGAIVRNRKESGVALVMSLLLLILMSILGLGMVLTVNSDVLINGYYGNYRSSFYAADAGLNLARQQLQNQVVAAVNSGTPGNYCASWGAANTANSACTYYPIANAGTAASNAMAYVISTYGASFNPLNVSGTQAANSWPGSFEISNASTFTLSSSPAAACSPCQYVYSYYLVSLGKGPGPQQVTTAERGQFTVLVDANAGPNTQKFSAFGAFINSFGANTNPLVYGTLTGPQWTNGSWNFGTGGSYVFTGKVGQSGPTISYDFSSSGCNPYCYVDSANSSATYKGQTIAPTFQQGISVNQPAAALPPNDFSQQWAILDGNGCGEGSNVCGNPQSPSPPTMTPATLHTYLNDINDVAYPTGGATSGVYLPYSGPTATPNSPPYTMNGGGFYIEGNVTSILLTPTTDGSGNLLQNYKIVQNGTTTTITTCITCNSGAGSTTVVSGSKTTNIIGVPHTTVNAVQVPQTMLYVDGTIGGSSGGGNYTGISGPGEGQAAIQDKVQLTVVAAGDITVNGDLRYKEEPVTLNAADTPIPLNDQGQVLGLYTATGNIVLNSPYSDNNLEIDGAISALSTACTQSSMQNTCGLETPTGINTLTIVGGRSEANAHGVNMNQSNTYYDTRFSNPNGFGPPWFPATTVGSGTPSVPTINPWFSRLNWYTSPQN